MNLQHSQRSASTSNVWTKQRATEILANLAETGEAGNCRKRKVGASIISLDGVALVSAANGAPDGMTRCDEGGCVRCAACDFPHGIGYDLCLCLHAEQNLLISAMSRGIALAGRILATTYQPCFMCAKLIVASHIAGVVFVEPWLVPEHDSKLTGLTDNYEALWSQLPLGCNILDGERTWALFNSASSNRRSRRNGQQPN